MGSPGVHVEDLDTQSTCKNQEFHSLIIPVEERKFVKTSYNFTENTEH